MAAHPHASDTHAHMRTHAHAFTPVSQPGIAQCDVDPDRCARTTIIAMHRYAISRLPVEQNTHTHTLSRSFLATPKDYRTRVSRLNISQMQPNNSAQTPQKPNNQHTPEKKNHSHRFEISELQALRSDATASDRCASHLSHTGSVNCAK